MKTIKINNEKVRVFEKKELKEKLNLNDDEIKLILDYQKIFPELLQRENAQIRSAKKLYDKVGLDKSHWAKWYKRNILENDFFKENKDWWVLAMSATTEKGGQLGRDFSITLDFAKHLVMLARTEVAHDFRDYFILIDKALRLNFDWMEKREPQKPINNKINGLLLKRYISIHKKRPTNQYIYSSNADMVNLIAFGNSAKEINEMLKSKNDGKTRDKLFIECLERITFLLNQNELLLGMGMDFDTRESMLIQMYESRFGNQIHIQGTYSDISYNRPYYWVQEDLI